jgi:predicted aldo/keto reductase-like oxidoreductase
VPYKTFAKLQDEFFAVSKKMRDAKDPEEKMKLLKELQVILKESHRVLEEIHKKSNQKSIAPLWRHDSCQRLYRLAGM